MSSSPRIVLSRRWHSGRNANAEPLPSLRFRWRYEYTSIRRRLRPACQDQPDRTKTPWRRPRESRSLQEIRRHICRFAARARSSGVGRVRRDRHMGRTSEAADFPVASSTHPTVQVSEADSRPGEAIRLSALTRPYSQAGAKRASSWKEDRFQVRSELMFLVVVARVWDAQVEAVERGGDGSWKEILSVMQVGGDDSRRG